MGHAEKEGLGSTSHLHNASVAIPLTLYKEKIPSLLWSKLMRYGIHYVDELLRVDLDAFAQLPGIGPTSLGLMADLQKKMREEFQLIQPSEPRVEPSAVGKRPIVNLPEDSPLRKIRFEDIAKWMPGLVYAKMKKFGFESVDDLCRISMSEFAALPSVGPKAVLLLSRFVVDLLANQDLFLSRSTSPEKQLVLAEEDCALAPSFEVFIQFLDVFIEFLAKTNPKAHEAFRRYYGWGTEGRLNCRETSKFLGVTRERVRQIIEAVQEQLRTLIFEGDQSVMDDRTQRAVQHTLTFTYGRLSAGKVLREARVAEMCTARNDTDPGKLQSAVEIFFKLYGVRKFHIYKPAVLASRIYIFDPELDGTLFLKTAKQVLRLLSAHPLPSAIDDLKQRLCYECPDCPPDYVDVFLRSFDHLFERVEVASEQCVQLRFDLLPSCAKMTWRVLHEHGEPLHFEEIIEIINERLRRMGSGKQFSGKGFIALVQGEHEVVPIGKTGMYALRSWKMETRYIKDLIESAFDYYGRPLTFEEIFNYVKNLRPDTNRSSLNTLVRMQCTHHIEGKRYVPHKWEGKQTIGQKENRK